MCRDAPPKTNLGSAVTLDIPATTLYNNTQNSNSTDYIVEDRDDDDDTAADNVCCSWMSTRVLRKKTLYKVLPILTWLPQYNRSDLIGDILAGITVGMTVIPLGLAFANIAGLDLQYGLYSCFMGCFVYIFFGSHKDVSVGPTALSAFLTFQAAHGSWQRTVLLTFLTGLIELGMGVFRLGFLIDFVSGPVSAGFTSAVALIIFTSQLRDILGVNTHGDTLLKMWTSVVRDIDNISWNDAGLGLCCVIVLLAMRLMVSVTFGPSEGKTRWQQCLTNAFWFLGTSRNAVLVCVTSGLGYYLISTGHNVFRMVGYVPQGLPTPALPAFSLTTYANSTSGEVTATQEGFLDIVGDFGWALIVIPLISLLENMAVVQAFANGKPCDATQELIAVGFCNVATALMQGFRGNGGLARGSVLNASGNRTQLSNAYTGLMVIVALVFFTPAFYYIPRATLAGIIVAAVIFLVQYRVVKPMWLSKKKDLIPGVATFFACLVLPLQIGILVGIGINVAFILYHAARPKLRVETMTTRNGVSYLMLTPDRCLIFPSVEFVRTVINKHGRQANTPVVMDCTYIYSADFSAAKAISSILGDFKARQQMLCFYNLQPKVSQVFEGLNKDLHIFYDLHALELVLEEGLEDSKL